MNETGNGYGWGGHLKFFGLLLAVLVEGTNGGDDRRWRRAVLCMGPNDTGTRCRVGIWLQETGEGVGARTIVSGERGDVLEG